MIYECTDCPHCANFDFGFRVICLHPELPPDEVCKYYPVADNDADNCDKFDDYVAKDFSWSDFGEAERYSEEKYGDVTYQGIREWCLMKLEEHD